MGIAIVFLCSPLLHVSSHYYILTLTFDALAPTYVREACSVLGGRVYLKNAYNWLPPKGKQKRAIEVNHLAEFVVSSLVC